MENILAHKKMHFVAERIRAVMHSSAGDKSVMVGHHANAFYFENTPRVLFIVFRKFIFAIKVFKYTIEGELIP
jgi:hypothetical protein